MNIWESLKKPIFILAPMEDVTDTVFRRMIIECGRPDLFFTEFTNVEGLASLGDRIVGQRLLFTPEEKPIIAQIWGKNPQHYYEAAKKIHAMGFDGIDINMGCPEKSVVKNGCCAALINTPTLASEIIHATQDGAEGLPVSVKTRIGYNTIATESWISFLLTHDLAAITVHGRTAKELSLVPTHWDEIQKAVELRNASGEKTLIIGNGDIESYEEAKEKVRLYSVDGTMIGRGIFQDPYLFSAHSTWKQETIQNRLLLLQRHVELYTQVWGENKHFPIMKKYVKIYVSGFDNASDIRLQLMEAKTSDEMIEKIHRLL